jgi:hypothetical protein
MLAPSTRNFRLCLWDSLSCNMCHVDDLCPCLRPSVLVYLPLYPCDLRTVHYANVQTYTLSGLLPAYTYRKQKLQVQIREELNTVK